MPALVRRESAAGGAVEHQRVVMGRASTPRVAREGGELGEWSLHNSSIEVVGMQFLGRRIT